MVLAEILMHNEDPYILLFDNFSSYGHVSNFGVQDDVRYQPKYSPFLNPCEMAGSCLKAAVSQAASNGA